MTGSDRLTRQDQNVPHLCPSCGFELHFNPRGRTPHSEKACPCCGIHFGYDDQLGDPDAAYARWRERWIDSGKRWWAKTPAPANFNADEQLAKLTNAEPENNPGT
jgi:hypothetical protein